MKGDKATVDGLTTVKTMTAKTFLEALTGARNETLKGILRDLLQGAALANYNGKVEFSVSLAEENKGRAMALANWDEYQNCTARITYDLHSFTCSDLGGLITKLRLE